MSKSTPYLAVFFIDLQVCINVLYCVCYSGLMRWLRLVVVNSADSSRTFDVSTLTVAVVVIEVGFGCSIVLRFRVGLITASVFVAVAMSSDATSVVVIAVNTLPALFITAVPCRLPGLSLFTATTPAAFSGEQNTMDGLARTSRRRSA